MPLRPTSPWVQARRLTCTCGEDFVYLASGRASLPPLFWETRGSTPAMFAEAAVDRFRDRFRAIEAAERAGRARCPSCNRYQTYMWISGSVLWQVALSLILSLGLGALVVQIASRPRSAWLWWIGAGTLALGVAGATYAASLRGMVPAGRPDPSVLSLTEFESLRADAREKGVPLEHLWLNRSSHEKQSPQDYPEILSARVATGGRFE